MKFCILIWSTVSFQFFTNKSSILIFPVICKISNFNMWTAKHLAQASCTELTLMYISSIFNQMRGYRILYNWPENSNSTSEIFWHQFQFIAHSINKSIQLKKSLKFVVTISDYSHAWIDFENFLSCHYLCRTFICIKVS